MVSGVTLLVDTSIVITAMAERALPRPDQRLSNLLRAAKMMGCQLIAGDDVINELDTHLDFQIAYNYRMSQMPGAVWFRHFVAPLLEQAYHAASFFSAITLAALLKMYIALFKGGKESPEEDLIDYMRNELEVEYRNLATEEKGNSDGGACRFAAEVEGAKAEAPVGRRTKARDFGRFTMYEHSCSLSKRKEGRSTGTYGHRWWWLADRRLGYPF